MPEREGESPMGETRDIRRAAPDAKSTVLSEVRAAIGDGPHRKDAHALVVGIDRYTDGGIPQLRYARADAEAMHAALVDPEVGRFDPAKVTLLVDERATRVAVLKALTALKRGASETDTVIVYFAGHGAPDIDGRAGAGGDGFRKYLITHDAEKDNLDATAIPMEKIQETFADIRARSLVFLLDACYSGTAGGRTFAPAVATRAMNLSADFLDEIASGEGRCVITSCGVNEVSVESVDFGHGLFTHYLLEGMRGAADANGSGAVDVDELFRYVRTHVRDAAGKCGAKMQPMLTGQMRGSVVITIPETPSLKRARELRAEAVRLQSAGDADGAEPLWREAAALDPADATATAALAAITERREAARRTREQAERERKAERARRANVLRLHFQSGDLSEELFAHAVEVLKAEASTLQGDDRDLRRLVDKLVIGEMPIGRFTIAASAVTGMRSSDGSDAGRAPVSALVPRIDFPRATPRRLTPTEDASAPPPVPAAPVPAAPVTSEKARPVPVATPPDAASRQARPLWRRGWVRVGAAAVLLAWALWQFTPPATEEEATSSTAAPLVIDSAAVIVADSGLQSYEQGEYAEALRQLTTAATAGESRAMFTLGILYGAGHGVPIDETTAVEWYRRAADAGNSDAMVALGRVYDSGAGVPASDSLEMAWYLQAAAAGNAEAMRYIGYMYEHAEGVPQSDSAAIEWYRRAAAAGDSIAIIKVGP
jgi:TPR repeat protein